jgi:hypothetical protein
MTQLFVNCYLIITVVVFISFSYRIIKLVLILVDYPICLSVKQNLFITLSCCRNTWIVLKKAACSWRLTCCGVGCTVFSGNGWCASTLLYAWFSKRNIYYAVFSFWDVLIQNNCSNAIQSCIVALSLCAFYKLQLITCSDSVHTISLKRTFCFVAILSF